MSKDSKLNLDLKRYESPNDMPKFQKWMRKYQDSNNLFMKKIYKMLFILHKSRHCIEISENTKIGGGLYIGHSYCITINPNTVIGENCYIHKNVTIGQESRGKRQGCPTIGDNVWIGINAIIIGKITVGNDVLIAPNSYVNFNVPSHSIVLGNPGKIIKKENATYSYIRDISEDIE